MIENYPWLIKFPWLSEIESGNEIRTRILDGKTHVLNVNLRSDANYAY